MREVERSFLIVQQAVGVLKLLEKEEGEKTFEVFNVIDRSAVRISGLLLCCHQFTHSAQLSSVPA